MVWPFTGISLATLPSDFDFEVFTNESFSEVRRLSVNELHWSGVPVTWDQIIQPCSMSDS